MIRATTSCIHGSLHPFALRKIPEILLHKLLWFFSQQGEQWQAALFSLYGAFVCGLGWAWGSGNGCVQTKGAFLKISGAEGPHVSFRDYLTHFKYTRMIGITCNIFNQIVEEALWNGVLHLFVIFWFLWCLIPLRFWHSYTHRYLTQKSASKVGMHGQCLSVGNCGEVGGRWWEGN